MSVYGSSGCSKYTFFGKFMLVYKNKHKNRPLYVFSSITDDPLLKKAEPVYIKIYENILSDPFIVKNSVRAKSYLMI